MLNEYLLKEGTKRGFITTSEGSLIPAGPVSRSLYYTTDPYFNRFPRSREPLIYHVNSAELQQHLTTAIPLEFDGLQFRRKP